MTTHEFSIHAWCPPFPNQEIMIHTVHCWNVLDFHGWYFCWLSEQVQKTVTQHRWYGVPYVQPPTLPTRGVSYVNPLHEVQNNLSLHHFPFFLRGGGWYCDTISKMDITQTSKLKRWGTGNLGLVITALALITKQSLWLMVVLDIVMCTWINY